MYIYLYIYIYIYIDIHFSYFLIPGVIEALDGIVAAKAALPKAWAPSVVITAKLEVSPKSEQPHNTKRRINTTGHRPNDHNHHTKLRVLGAQIFTISQNNCGTETTRRWWGGRGYHGIHTEKHTDRNIRRRVVTNLQTRPNTIIRETAYTN